MRFNIPKFVTTEDKILVGPFGITFKQLFLLFGAFLISYAGYKFIGGFIGILIILISFSLAIILGFVKINNKYVISFLPKLITILISSKRYIWQEEPEITNKIIKIPEIKKYIELLEQDESLLEENKKEKKQIHLSKFLQYAHKHGYNPKDPYLNFPLPKFPKRRW
jgi:hypothetical protein